MSGKNLYRAMGEIDDKYIRSAEKMMERKEPNKAVSGVFSVLKYAGAFALVAAVVLAIWIPSRFFPRDPDPIQSGTATEQQTQPVTDPVTEPVTDTVTEPVTDTVTEPVTDTETDAPGPMTDEEIIAALVDDLAANGYDADK
jgi:hypothetical protein